MVDTLLVGLRVVLSLAIVLAVLWFCARQLGGRGQATRRVPITVLGRQSLGRHSGISVVEVAGRTLVIGVSDAGVRLLTEVDTPAVEEAADAAATGDVAGRAVDGAGDEDRHDGAGVAALAAGATRRSVSGRRGQLRLATSPEPRTEDSFAAILAEQDPAPRHRARRRETAAPTGTGPLAGSILDPASWTRTRAVLQDRGRR